MKTKTIVTITWTYTNGPCSVEMVHEYDKNDQPYVQHHHGISVNGKPAIIKVSNCFLAEFLDSLGILVSHTERVEAKAVCNRYAERMER